jgi:hypothetical protein
MNNKRSALSKKLLKIPLYFLFSLAIVSCSQGTSTLGNSNSETVEPSQTSSPSPEISLLVQILNSTIDLEQSQKNMCDILNSELKIERKRISSVLKAVVEVPDDPYKASDFISSVDFTTSSNYRDELGNKFENNILYETFKSVTQQNSISFPSPILSEFAESTFTTCGLAKEWENLRTDANSIDSKLETLNSLSSNVPWYPEGYDEILSGDYAYKNISKSANVDCYECRYAVMNFITKFGCPSGLYVEVNFMDSSGTVYDWSNDTLPTLGARQKARLEFITYRSSGGSGTWRIANINCY